MLREELPPETREVLQFGKPVTLVNKDTGEELEQTFWFLFDFPGNDRFLILVFEYDKKSSLYHNRKLTADSLKNFRDIEGKELVFLFSNDQIHSYHMLCACSAMFFINSRNGRLPGSILTFVEDGGLHRHYVVLDILKLKTRLKLETDEGDMFEIVSLLELATSRPYEAVD